MSDLNIVELLNNANLTVSTAESFTGGLLGSKIVEFPHASKCYKGGVISYTKDAKESLLGIGKEKTLGSLVYSMDVARLMANSIMEKTGSDISVGTTGVAGPGSDEGVEAGILFYSIKYKSSYIDKALKLGSDRHYNREEAIRLIFLDLKELIESI